jgi:hypothetical protein
VLVIRDYEAEITEGTLAAADDAADARWVDASSLGELPLTGGLADALAAWGVISRTPAG